VSQRGSHIKLENGSLTIIVPAHKPIKRSTLAAILKQAGLPSMTFSISFGSAELKQSAPLLKAARSRIPSAPQR
jgi:hypothetical protein